MTAPELAEMHTYAARTACPKPPRGCGQPVGEWCVNGAAARPAGAAPRTSRIPHPSRLRAAETPVPAPRELEVPLPPEQTDDDGYDDERPF